MFEEIDVQRVMLTPEGERLLDQVEYARQLCDQLRRARAYLIELPLAVREQLRIECISYSDAAHELNRLEKTRRAA